MTQLSLGAGDAHVHLRLTRALDPKPRRKLVRGGGPEVRSDHRSHARDIRAQLAKTRERHKTRERILGIDPELILVVELNAKAAAAVDAFDGAGLQLLDVTGARVMTLFADDAELTEFRQRLDQYENEVTDKTGNPRFLNLFGYIETVRRLEPSDVIDPELEDLDNSVVRVDIECWTPDNRAEAMRRHDETLGAVAAAGGTVLDNRKDVDAGLSVIRADVPGDRILDLARTDRVSWIKRIPRPLLRAVDVTRWSRDALPPVVPPPADAPIVAVIDSGVQPGHPLVEPAFHRAESVDGTDGSDVTGHGTMVASIALHGSLERPLHSHEPLTARGRLVSIRVLNEHNEFSNERLWENQLLDAVDKAIDLGARVINLSLGDPKHPYVPPRPVGIAAALDRMVAEHDVIVVVSAGNVHPEEHDGNGYAAEQLHLEERNLAPPAMAALALTVGALVPEHDQGAVPARESVDVNHLGTPGDPSPASRTGPGIEDAVKPELSASGGTYVYDRAFRNVRQDAARGTVVAASGARPERLLRADIGTSFAAPLVSHAALRVLAKYPGLSANAVRALLLSTSTPVDRVIDSATDAHAQRMQRFMSGYGKVSAERAETSTEHRVLLIAEEELRIDQVHFYDVDVPSSFFTPGAKTVAIGLSFDPDTRGTRLQYLESRMAVHVYRGRSSDDVQAKFAANAGEPPEELENAKVNLQPSAQDRLAGPNQAASALWKRDRWDAQKHSNLVVVVQNTGRWAPEGKSQRYALAVQLEVEESMPGIYADLHTRFDTVLESEAVVETEVRLGH